MWTYYETEAPWKVCIHYKNLCAGLYPKYAAKNSRPPQLSPAPPYFGGAYGGAAGPPIQKTLAKALPNVLFDICLVFLEIFIFWSPPKIDQVISIY